MDLFVMLIGLGFFIFIIHLVTNGEDRDYQRRLNEAREFGYDLLHQRKISKLKFKRRAK